MATALRLDLKVAACRFCGTPLDHSFADLGVSPPANSFIPADALSRPETFYPLHAYVCESCLLVQLEELASPEQLFTDYAYFSSYSDSWLRHAQSYAQAMIRRLDLGPHSQVIEVASNDGYLLQYFARDGVPVLGIEPAANVAQVAESRGIATIRRFFGRATARALIDAGTAGDLVIGNNVLAHVPNLNDFVAALRMVLKPEGVITLEFPHLLRLIADTQFDTIYHEHFSYFSFHAVDRVLAAHGIRVFDVEQLTTHGGSLRIFAAHEASHHAVAPSVARLHALEKAAGLDQVATYDGFMDKVRLLKRQLLSFLIEAKDSGKSVAAYGAAAKGTTLLNYCGVGPDLIDYVVDRSPHKQGLFLPGVRIPVLAPDHIRLTRPDYLLILPWNLTDEIVAANAHIRDWGGRFVVPAPQLSVLP